MTRDGFQAMVAYTAPVFWLFLLLVGISYFVLRRREPNHQRPFRAPFYPLIPALFCLTCAYFLYASLAYTGLGALVGVTVTADRHPGGVARALPRDLQRTTMIKTPCRHVSSDRGCNACWPRSPPAPMPRRIFRRSELPGVSGSAFRNRRSTGSRRPTQKGAPLWQWECDRPKAKTRKPGRSNGKRC
jgi:hypothetical protein